MKSTYVQRLAMDAGTDSDWFRKAIEFGVRHYGFNAKTLAKQLNSEFRRRINNTGEVK